MKILPRPVAAERAGISVSTLKRLEAADDFPARFPVTPGRVGYLESEVDHWISERVAAARRADEPSDETKDVGDDISSMAGHNGGPPIEPDDNRDGARARKRPNVSTLPASR